MNLLTIYILHRLYIYNCYDTNGRFFMRAMSVYITCSIIFQEILQVVIPLTHPAGARNEMIVFSSKS